MRVDALMEGLKFASAALSTLREAKEFLRKGSKEAEVEAILEQAEKELKIATSKVSLELGSQLCYNHVPPEVMVSKNEVNWKCPACGNKKDTPSALPASGDKDHADHLLDMKRRMHRIAFEE